MVVYYINQLRSITSKVASNQDEIEESPDFAFFPLNIPNQIDDIEVITGQRRNMTWRARRKFLQGMKMEVHVFSTRPHPEDIPKEFNDDHNPRIAIIPLNPESSNASFRTREIQNIGTCSEQRFLSAVWKVSSDKRYVRIIRTEETNYEQL